MKTLKLTLLVVAACCFGVISIAQPANDNFCDAAVLTIDDPLCAGGGVNGNNTGSTVETNEPIQSCSYYGDLTDATVWYQFTAPAGGVVDISTDYGPYGNDDTQITVYEDPGGCPTADLSTLVEIACSEDNGTVAFLLSFIDNLSVTPGSVYYIMVDGFAGTAGDFCISVEDASAPVPSTKLCGATALTVNAGGCTGGAPNGDNTGATAETGEVAGICFVGGTNAVWYQVVIPAGITQIRVSTDFQHTNWEAGDDTEVALWSIPDCNFYNNAVEVGCDQDGGDLGDGFLSTLEATVVPGQTYYINVSGWLGWEGDFCVQVDEVLPCAISNISAGTPGPCDGATGNYDVDVTVTYSDAPSTGTLDVNGASFAITTSPQTVTLSLPADGNPVDVTASFSADAACTSTANALFTAPAAGTCADLTCADGPFSYCYADDLVDEVVAQVCPDVANGTVNIIFSQGTLETCCDELAVYSGPSGSGTSGTLLAGGLTGDLTSLEFSSAPNECIIVVINSDGSVACSTGSQTEIIFDCSTECTDVACAPFLTGCAGINILPQNTFPASLDDFVSNNVPDANSGGTASICFDFTVSAGEAPLSGTFFGLPFTNELGDTDGTLECATTESFELFVDPGFSACGPAIATDPNIVDLAAGNYVVCFSYALADDNTAGDGTTEGTCTLGSIGLAFTPIVCTANAGTFTPAGNQLLCFGESITYATNGDWANPLPLAGAGPQDAPAGLAYGIYSVDPMGAFPVGDANLLGILGSEPTNAAGVPTLLNDIGGGASVWIAAFALSDEAGLIVGTEQCFDISAAVEVTFLDEITGTASFTCNAASDAYDVLLSNVTGGIPGFSGGTYTVSDDAGGPGDAALPVGGSYLISDVAPGTTVNITISDASCSQVLSIDVPDLTAPVLASNAPYCIFDADDQIFTNPLGGDLGFIDVDINLDQFQGETAVRLLDATGSVIADLPPTSFNDAGQCGAVTVTFGPLPTSGTYTFQIIDTWGDGMQSNNGACFGTVCGPGDFTVIDQGTGTVLVPTQPFLGEDSDGDECDQVVEGDTPTGNATVETLYGEIVLVRSFPGLIPTVVFNLPISYAGNGITDNLDGSATFSPGTAGVGSWPVTVSYTDINGCDFTFIENIDVTDNSAPSGNGISTYSDVIGGGGLSESVNESNGFLFSETIDNSCVLNATSPLVGLQYGGGKPNSGFNADNDLFKAPCDGTYNLNNAPVFYTFKNGSFGGNLNVTVTPDGSGNYSDVTMAIYGPVTPGNIQLSNPGAGFIECERGDGTTPTTLSLSTLTPDATYLIIVSTSGGTAGTGTYVLSAAGLALPIQLSSFFGEVEDRENMLYWETSFEENIQSYEIQRSKTGNGDWETIGTVAALNNGNDGAAYEFADVAPFTEGYYRLHVIEFDGIKSYSDVIFLKRESTDFGLNEIRPNPTQANIQVIFTAPAEGKVAMNVYDVLGRTVFQDQFNANSGLNQINYDMSGLSNGVYFIQLDNGQELIVEKVIKK
ncbi:MAG: T9SS type A sorting domain-containing protein [Bacteroidota bacterium]